MSRSVDQRPYTLAQFARRAGISEGRARALYAARQSDETDSGSGSGSGLPRPDRTDADGRPLWWAATIDAWCARTGRDVDGDALWIFQVPAADRPAAELRREVVHLQGRGDRQRAFFVIVWDSDAGHVVYLQPLGETGGAHKDWLAVYAADLLEPRWWGEAVIVMPVEEGLAFHPELRDEPICYLYRLRTEAADSDGRVAGGQAAAGRRGARGLGRSARRVRGSDAGRLSRRWVGLAEREEEFLAVPRAEWVTHVDLGDIARVVGRPVPAWLADTTSPGNAQRGLVFGDRTFTTEDTVTEWPLVQQLVAEAVDVGLAQDYPAGFAALAVDAADELGRIKLAHDNTTDTGTGWYLVCRPALPAPPIDLEQRILGARRVVDVELVRSELRELIEVEGELDIDDPRGEVYAKAVEALTAQLRDTARESAEHAGVAVGGVVPVADERVARFSAPWSGPVIDAWRATLTEVADLKTALRLRRVRSVLADDVVDQVHAAFRDPAGRHVLVLTRAGDQEWFVAEWPVELSATASWTDKTMIAGDSRRTVTALLALTSAEDGGMRVDPVPLPPRSARDGFAYGYGGGTPATTYRAILRCALGDDRPGTDSILRRSMDRDPEGRLISRLRHAIHTTDGPLRLPWDTVKGWAVADARRAI